MSRQLRKGDRNRFASPRDELKALDIVRNKKSRENDDEDRELDRRLRQRAFNKKLLAGEIPATRPPVHARIAKKNMKVVSLASVRLADVEE